MFLCVDTGRGGFCQGKERCLPCLPFSNHGINTRSERMRIEMYVGGGRGAWITTMVPEGIMSYLYTQDQIKIYTLFINCARNK